MRIVNIFVAASLALIPAAACKKKNEEAGGVTAKTVEESEKEAINAREDVNDQRGDVVEAKKDLNEQQNEMAGDKADFNKQRDEFVTNAKTKMAALEARIDALKADAQANAAQIKGAARKDLDELMAKIDMERAEAKTAYDAAVSGTVEKWNDLEKNTGEALSDLEETTNDAIGKLKDAGVKVRAELDPETK